MNKILGTVIFIIGLISNVNAQKPKITKPSTGSFMVTGKLVYTKHCVVCHQADGGGVMGLNPPLIKNEYVLGDQKRLINIVLKGLNQEIEIDGETYANPMPGLSHLTDQQVADVLSFVRNSFGNKASAITTTQVKAIRASKK